MHLVKYNDNKTIETISNDVFTYLIIITIDFNFEKYIIFSY